MLESAISMAVSLLVLLLLFKLVVAVFGGSDGPSESDDGYEDLPGQPGRWNSPLERDRYYRARGNEVNWME